MLNKIDMEEVIKGLHDLFEYVFVTNCHLDEESVTSEELQTLKDLDSLEVLENFKDLATDLLNFKRDNKASDQAELVDRCKQFEEIIQKLEGDVRKHIRIQQQLKLHIESLQGKNDELQRRFGKNNFARKDVKSEFQLKSSVNGNFAPELDYNGFNNEFDKRAVMTEYETKHDSSHKTCEIKIQRLSELAERRQKQLRKLEHQCLKLKGAYEEKFQECEQLRRDNDSMYKQLLKIGGKKMDQRTSKDLEQLRKKLEQKSEELNKIQQKITLRKQRRSPFPRPKSKTQARRSIVELEISPNLDKDDAGFQKKGKTLTRRKHRRSSRGHARSSSEGV